MKEINKRISKTDISKILIMFGIWMRGRGLASSPINYDGSISILQFFIMRPFVWAAAPWLIRIPGLVASILALAVIWEMMEDWEVTNNQRLWVSALTLLPGFYWMAQDARGIAMMGLLYLLTFWLMMGGQYVWGSITIGLMIWGHPTGLILTMSILIVNVLRDWMLQGMMGIRDAIFNKTLRANLISYAVGICIGLPAIIIKLLGPGSSQENQLTLVQMIDNIHAAVFVDSLSIEWINALAGIMLIIYFILAILITFTAWARWLENLKDPVKTIQDDIVIIDDIVITNFLLTIVPVILMIIVSVIIEPVINYRALMILLWPMILWVGSATAMQEYKPVKLILPGILAAVIVMAQH